MTDFASGGFPSFKETRSESAPKLASVIEDISSVASAFLVSAFIFFGVAFLGCWWMVETTR